MIGRWWLVPEPELFPVLSPIPFSAPYHYHASITPTTNNACPACFSDFLCFYHKLYIHVRIFHVRISHLLPPYICVSQCPRARAGAPPATIARPARPPPPCVRRATTPRERPGLAGKWVYIHTYIRCHVWSIGGYRLYLSVVCMFICLSVCLFVCLSVYLSACLFVYLSICLSGCLCSYTNTPFTNSLSIQTPSLIPAVPVRGRERPPCRARSPESAASEPSPCRQYMCIYISAHIHTKSPESAASEPSV